MKFSRNQLLVGDALSELRRLPSDDIDMVLTSPPYFRLRDYDVDGQLGLEAHVDDWVGQLGAVGAELARVLTPTGTLWLNLGDAYATHSREGALRKSLLLAPERLALQLVADGWVLRNKIIWQKSNPMPTSVRDRLACTWEVIYVFARSSRHHFNLDALRQPHLSRATSTRPPSGGQGATSDREHWLGPNADGSAGLAALKAAGRVGHPLGKNPGDVWRLASSRYRGAHHATFPLALASQAISAGCPVRRCSQCRAPYTVRTLVAVDGARQRSTTTPACGCNAVSEPGLVLDPFFGAATTGLAAEQLGRDWLGIELNPAFAAAGLQRLAQARASPAAA